MKIPKQRIKRLGDGWKRQVLDELLLSGFSLKKTRLIMFIVYREYISVQVLFEHRQDLFRKKGINLQQARENGRKLLRGSRKLLWLSKDKKIRDLWYEMREEMRRKETEALRQP